MRVRSGRWLILLLLLTLPACSQQRDEAAAAPTSTATSTTATPTATVSSTPTPVSYAYRVNAVTAEQLPYTYTDGCPVPVEDLRLLTVTHHGFDGTPRTGELVVHVEQADAVGRIFGRLYDAGFPIERMRLVDAYGGSTEASLADNNTSGFHCRPVTGGTRWSEHAYGWAIDVNPVQNPYVRGDLVLPESGRAFLDRSIAVPGLILEGDPVVAAFAAEGWTWGDYQHFSLTGR
jgi:D-alanyl-D-alanine carboxypeptidase